MLNLIFPPRCIGCEAWLKTNGLLICQACYAQLHFLKTPAVTPALKKCWFDAAYSVLAYEGKLLDWLHQYKYHRQFHVGKTLSTLFSQSEWACREADGIVPVPLHGWRHWRRGFNPSHFLADALAQKINKPLWPVLKKKRHTQPQTKLTRQERLQNVKGTFFLSKWRSGKIKGKRIWLIDDVLTTGATVNECAKVLKKAGAREVVVLTLARTL